MTTTTGFEPTARVGHPRRRAARRIASGAAFLVMGMVSVMNLAIPTISTSDLHPSATQLLWVVDGYTIVFACLLVPAGALADRYGRKGFLLVGLTVYVIGCLASGLAPTIALLLAARFFTGLGAAFVFSTTLSIIVNIHTEQERPKAVTGWTVAVQAAGMVAATAGGALVQFGGWRMMFLVFAVLASCATVCVAAYVPRTQNVDTKVDLAGSALLIVGLTSLLYMIIEGSELGWTSSTVIASGIMGIAVIAYYAVRSWGKRHALLDTALFRIPKLRAGTVGVMVGFLAMFALFYVNSQYLQFVKGYTPLVAGLATIPMPLWNAVVSAKSLRVADCIGARATIASGLAILVLGLSLLSTLTAATPYAVLIVYLLLMATGIGLSAPLLSNAIIGSLPANRVGAGSGLNSLMRELGAAMGIATMGTIIQAHFFSHIAGGEPQSSVFSRLLTSGNTDMVDKFVSSVDLGYRTIGVVLLVVSVFVIAWFRNENPAESA
ncbi:MFS transporter [Streptomyces caniferus]|uniref:MFS transporter n=1 Tax=Streptomyces caniferus TaxID=285557 RepID=UPI0034557ACF